MAAWSRLKAFVRETRGVAAIEFAIAGPVLVLMAGGVYELGSALQEYAAINKMASQYAIAWADCFDQPSGTCQTELGLYTPSYAVQNLWPFLKTGSGAPTLRMIQVKMSGTTPNVVYSSPSNIQPTAAETALLQQYLSDQQMGVVVSISYTHSLGAFSTAVNGILPNSMLMNYSVVQMKAN